MKHSYTQCDLRRQHTDGSESRRVAFLPSSYAIDGHTVRLKIDGRWCDGWRIVATYASYDEPFDSHKIAHGHRRATGDADTR